MVGQSISHYRIISELGRGGMGVVYRAEDISLGRSVALKILPSHAIVGDHEKARFLREARSAAALNHAHIATIYEVGEHDGTPFIAMEFVEGESLDALIENGPLTISETIRLCLEVASALEAAHEAGIVHRDIKSANIMLTKKSEVKVLDFGLAKSQGATTITQEGSTVGTIAYMSPEQAQGLKVDTRSDLFSLGIVLYEMVTGRRPFESAYESAIVYSILNADPEPMTALRTGVPMELERIAVKLMAKDRSARYQSATDLIVDLKNLQKDLESGVSIVETRTTKIHAPNKRVLGLARRSVLAGTTVLLALAVWIIVRSFPTNRMNGPGITSVAVLPLANMTGDPEQEFFVDGMTQTLIGELSKLSALKVISRQSVMQFKGSELPLPVIAGKLGVQAVVEGSVYREGSTVRISASLVDAGSDQSIWSQDFDRRLENVLALHSDVARTIAREIEVSVTPVEEVNLASARVVDPIAYEDYLRGTFYWGKLTPEDLSIALEYFEAALDKDPNYALAYAGVANVWGGRRQMGITPPDVATPQIEAAIAKAMSIDSEIAEIQYSYASMVAWGRWQFDEAAAAYRKAIELNPNYPSARIFYAHLLMVTGHLEEALEQGERGLELDPLNPLLKAAYAVILTNAQRYNEAIAYAREATAVIPNHAVAATVLFHAYYRTGRLKESLQVIEDRYLSLGDTEVANALQGGYIKGGYKMAMLQAADVMSKRYPEVFTSPFRIAGLYHFAGDMETAFTWLETAFEIRDPGMPYLSASGLWSDVQDEPRTIDLLRRIGLRD